MSVYQRTGRYEGAHRQGAYLPSVTHIGSVYIGETWADARFRQPSMLLFAESTEDARAQIKSRVEERGLKVVKFNGAERDIGVLVRPRRG